MQVNRKFKRATDVLKEPMTGVTDGILSGYVSSVYAHQSRQAQPVFVLELHHAQI